MNKEEYIVNKVREISHELFNIILVHELFINLELKEDQQKTNSIICTSVINFIRMVMSNCIKTGGEKVFLEILKSTLIRSIENEKIN